SSRSVVSGAKVTATDERTSFARTVLSSANGGYILHDLAPSFYRITAEAPGFHKYVQEHIELRADQSLTLDATLTVGATSESITVQEATPQVDTVTGPLREVIDQQRIVELPLNGRNAASLTTLVAGAVSAPSNGAFQSSTFGNQPVGGQASAVTISTN